MRYGNEPALRSLNLRLEDGEAIALLGPSGSGKTTVLRVVAGFEEPSAGDVLFDERPMKGVPPSERNLAMVFQGDALFPNMDVEANIGFPLRLRRMPRVEIAARVEAETRAAGIAALIAKRPGELSAGQRRVVQIARAMVRRPDLMLVDEPFAGLDHVGTERLRAELRMVQGGYGVTALYATHAHADAMVLADRVALIAEGRIHQVGDPHTMYEEPADVMVATYVGEPTMTLLEATRVPEGISVGGMHLPVPVAIPARVTLGVRPEAWAFSNRGLEALVSRVYSTGPASHVVLETSGGEVVARSGGNHPNPGEKVLIRPSSFHLFDPSSGKALYHSGVRAG